MNPTIQKTIEEKACEVKLWENVISRCWKPDCRNVAIGRDGSGWEWCNKHFDQENTGSILHTKQEDYDFDFYKERVKKSLTSQAQRMVEEATREGYCEGMLDARDVGGSSIKVGEVRKGTQTPLSLRIKKDKILTSYKESGLIK